MVPFRLAGLRTTVVHGKLWLDTDDRIHGNPCPVGQTFLPGPLQTFVAK
jgi:hypothetical protein